jgi:hypothetical protein
MESETTSNTSTGRSAAISAFAVVGFIALILVGVWLAIYTSRHTSKLSSKLNSASVSLSSIFHKDEPKLEVVATSTKTSLPIEAATTTATSTVVVEPAKQSVSSPEPSPAPVQQPVVVTPVPAPLYGNPDLAITVSDVGFTAQNGNTASFVGSNDIPFGQNGAIKFTVTNVGTNASGAWNFAVNIPTSPMQNYVSPLQPSLNPGDSVDFTLGFDRGYSTGQKTITVTVDPDNRINESNKGNNVSSRWIIVD